MNSLTIIGRITKNAETRTVNVGGVATLVTDFTIACNEGYGETQSTEFFRVTMWREKGAKMAPHLLKGRIMAVKGTVTARPWLDSEGKPRAQLEVKNASVEFVDKKPGDPEEAPAVDPEEAKPF